MNVYSVWILPFDAFSRWQQKRLRSRGGHHINFIVWRMLCQSVGITETLHSQKHLCTRNSAWSNMALADCIWLFTNLYDLAPEHHFCDAELGVLGEGKAPSRYYGWNHQVQCNNPWFPIPNLQSWKSLAGFSMGWSVAKVLPHSGGLTVLYHPSTRMLSRQKGPFGRSWAVALLVELLWVGFEIVGRLESRSILQAIL